MEIELHLTNYAKHRSLFVAQAILGGIKSVERKRDDVIVIHKHGDRRRFDTQ